jgi:hypothetical protein
MKLDIDGFTEWQTGDGYTCLGLAMPNGKQIMLTNARDYAPTMADTKTYSFARKGLL